MKTNKSLLSLTVASTLALTSAGVSAAGFQLAEYSSTGLGRAYAGEAAMADNASAQWRNPAMLTYLEGTQLSTGAIYVDPNLDVEGTVSHPTFGQHNASSKDFANSAVIPNFYLSHQINKQWFAGLALGTNYGMETELESGFAGSHFGNQAMIKTVEVNLNLAYQLNADWSLGGGLRYVMGEGHFGAVTPNHLPSTPTPITGGVLPAAGSTLKYMEGDDTAFGWQLGTAWQINPDHRIGFTYKSEVEMELEGYATGVGFGLALANAKDSGSMTLALPATAEIASHHQVTEALALHMSVNWTDWSSFEKLEAVLNNYGTQMVKVENWEDNYRFAIGATYQVDSKLAVRTGIAYDTSAVSDQNRTITIPETDRTWLSLGATYDVSKALTLDAGITYIMAKDASIKESRGYDSDDSAEKVGGQFVGTTTGNVWLIGVQANYRF
ncbi:outer membrane protein transport protein [Vibrio sonorensis]|uniref:outer membrane protein transport protein n=1 Tax=Vibrio sonorensis TaxID=1004316 RepID=UPI0008D9D039|nr:outer membrane protein transport protein [Vibrio sonorensis]